MAMNSLSILGTTSDAGKTTVVMALCKIFADQGYRVAPFKAQNVSNNSGVGEDERELARAQYFQAEAAGVPATYHLNPVMLKSHGNGSVHIVLNGQVHKSNDVYGYYRELDSLKTHVSAAFEYLQDNYDFVIAEGAGSPVELNLIHKDLSNTFIAEEYQTKLILVADIERGGVFASIYGTLELLDPALRKNVIGVIVNKFRGDQRFFEEGRKIIEERFQVPVLGVVPYQALNIDMEDSYSLQNYQQRIETPKIKLAIIAYPSISNYNDVDPLMADPEIHVDIIQHYRPLSGFDMVVLAGSKTTIRDLQWLKHTGLFSELQQFTGQIFGICGGYQMLFKKICDPLGVEAKEGSEEQGLGLIDDYITFANKKVLKRQTYQAFDHTVKGYEIHMGKAAKYPLYYHQAWIAGTHIHGIFDNNAFRTEWFKKINPKYIGYDYSQYRTDAIQEFVDMVAESVDCEQILQALAKE